VDARDAASVGQFGVPVEESVVPVADKITRARAASVPTADEKVPPAMLVTVKGVEDGVTIKELGAGSAT